MRDTTGALAGKMSMVTGGGSGIGRAICRAFAAAGARVAIVERDRTTANETAEMIRDAGGEAHVVICDLSQDSQIPSMVENVFELLNGHIEILCNNAGIMDGMEMTHDVPVDLWNRVIATNLTAPFLIARAVLPRMLTRGQGSIINIASIAGQRGAGGGAAYTASKHGLVGLTRNMAWTYANKGIRCNAICPGAVATNVLGKDGVAALNPAGMQRLLPALALMEKTAQPDQIANVALFLASEAADFVNGAIIPVDGGTAGT